MPWWNPLKSLAKKLGLGKKEEQKEDEEKEGLGEGWFALPERACLSFTQQVRCLCLDLAVGVCKCARCQKACSREFAYTAAPEHEGFVPHKGSANRFSCKDSSCWCRRLGSPNDPVIQLAGASMQLLEAAHNQSLGHHLKFDPDRTTGVTIFMRKSWSEVKEQREKFQKQVDTELQEVLRTEGKHIEVFGCERWPYVDKETHAKNWNTKVLINLHSLALQGRLLSAWRDPESALHTQADTLPMMNHTHDIKPGTPFTKTVMAQLLEKGADVNVFDRSGITPLHYAARQLNVEQVKLLLANKADPCIVDCHGNSPLHYAAMTATSWKPPPSDMVKGKDQAKGHKGACNICGHAHISKPCPLKVKISAIVGKLKKSVTFRNNLDLTAQGMVMNQDKFDDIERVAKKNLEVAPNDECRCAIEASRQNAIRLQDVVAKLFQKAK